MEFRRFALVFALAFYLISLTVTATPAAASSPTYPTSAISETGMVQIVLGSSQGVLVNYTSSFAESFNGFVYMDLTNNSSQTVAWNVASCVFTQGQGNQCYVGIPLSLSSGNYTAIVFITTPTDVAVSASSSLNVTI